MAKLDRTSTEITEATEEQNALSKAKPQPELDETLERLTKQVAKGGGIAFGGSVVGRLAGFGLHILLGRVLGPGAYGLYALGTSVTGIAQSVGSLGLNQGVVRFCAMYRGEGDNARVKGTIISALAISLVSSILIAAILFALSGAIAQKFFNEPELTWVLRVFALALPFYVLMGITTSFAQSFRRIDYQQGVRNVFRPLVNLALVGSAFLLGFRLVGAVYGFAVSGLLSAALGFYLLWRLFPEIKLPFEAQREISYLLRFSVATLFVGISYLLLSYTDRIMLGFFQKAAEVGVYNAASATALQLTIFLGAFLTIFAPMASDLHSRGDLRELNGLFRIVTRWVLSLTLPLVVVLSAFSKTIMLIFGAGFATGWTVLVILSFAQLVNASTGPVGALLQMTGRQNIDLLNGIALLAGNVGLNVWLIPLYGAIGAAIATGISLTCIHVLRLTEVAILLRMSPYDKRYLKPIAAGVAATLVAILTLNFRPNPEWIWSLVGICATLATYSALLLGMGLDQEDKAVILAVKSRILRINPR